MSRIEDLSKTFIVDKESVNPLDALRLQFEFTTYVNKRYKNVDIKELSVHGGISVCGTEISIRFNAEKRLWFRIYSRLAVIIKRIKEVFKWI